MAGEKVSPTTNGKIQNKIDDVSVLDEELEVSSKCGYGKCAPDCIQPCATPGMLLVACCTFALVESFVQWGLVNISLATWERRYQMSSGQSVWIITSKDIIAIFLTPVVGYMAPMWHKGRLLTAGAICGVIGNFLFLVPQFATDPYELGSSESGGTCDLNANVTHDECSDNITDGDLSNWLIVFICAQVFFVVTSTSLWTVGVTYVDDNCRHEDTALYMGILNSMGALGATLGFIGGGLSLEVYVDVFKVDMDTIDIDSSDPRWVGAWWIGFLAALVFSAVPLFLLPCFPREVPAAIRWRKAKKSHAYKGRGDDEGERQLGKCSDIGNSLKVLFGNPVFDLVTLGGILEIGAVTAFAAFLPKIIQFQFGQTTSVAAVVAGVVLIPASVIGQLVGGFIPKYGNLDFKGIIWMQVIAAYICAALSFCFLAKCDPTPLAGYNAAYPFNSSNAYEDELTHGCNAACNCTTLVFEPICGPDSMSYFSPCYGSCVVEEELDDGTMVYGNCSCMPNATSPYYQAEEGMCPVECTKFWIFMPLLFIIILCTFIESTGGYATVMRVVPEKQRAFAFGMQGPLMKLLGTVPIPIIFSAIFDKSCEVWQDNCGEQGSCWIYNVDFLSMGMFLALLVVKLISGTCFLIAVLVYKPPPTETIVLDITEVDDAERNDGQIQHIEKVDMPSDEKHSKTNTFTNDLNTSHAGLGSANDGFVDDIQEVKRRSSTASSGPLYVTKL